MTLHIYQVGQLYSPNRTQWPETGEYNYRANSHELRLFYKNITPGEITAITRRPCQLGAVVQDGILFFVYQFGRDPWSDAPYSWHMVNAVRPEEATIPPPLQEQERSLLQVVLVEATTGIIAGLRTVSLSINLSRYLHQAITKQIAQPFDQAVHDQALARVYATTTSEQLARRAERMVLA